MPNAPTAAIRAAMPAAMLALGLVLACLCVASGCAGNGEAISAPKARSAAGGVKVEVRARLVTIKAGIPRNARRVVVVDGGRGWMLQAVVTAASPAVSPFAPGAKVNLAITDPVDFFLTNDIQAGSRFDRSFVVWKAPDGSTRAHIAN